MKRHTLTAAILAALALSACGPDRHEAESPDERCARYCPDGRADAYVDGAFTCYCPPQATP